MQKLIIIDGAALLARCYHGNLPLAYKKAKTEEEKKELEKYILQCDGIYTNGVFNFMKTVEKIITEQKPTHMAITFDATRNTFRKEMYPNYKGTRKESSAPFKQQKQMLPIMLSDMGFKVFMSNSDNPATTVEGDDLIGSLCNQFKSDINISVYTNDHDMLQLVGPGVNVWLDVRSHEKAETMFYEYTQGVDEMTLSSLNIPKNVFPFARESVKWDMGVYPELVPALKGLAGDTSDNIPGVKGVSKIAVPLLNHYGSIEGIFNAVNTIDEKELKEEWKKIGITRPNIKPFLAEGAKESAVLSEKLATIITTLKFNIALDDLKINVNLAERKRWYEKLRFKSFLYETA